jgi:hypothetical protein
MLAAPQQPGWQRVAAPVKLAASAVAATCAVALVVIVAPALSAAPYRPKAIDFELAPPPGAGVAAKHEFVSRPLRAPKRFNLVGVRWRGRAEPRLAVRTRHAGGEWTRWAGLAVHSEDGPDPGSGEARGGGSSSPVWVGEADEVQYRMSRRVPGLRLHFVNVQGTATRADRARTAIRRLVGAAVGSLARAVGARSAQAQEPQPQMVFRSGWEAGQCTPRSTPGYGSVKAAFIHHTVSLNDYTPQEAPGVVLSICRYHRNSNGWNDIGYNFLVDRYGVLYEGRAGGVDQPVVGAQAQGYNTQSTGIANVGNHSSVPQSSQALDAVSRLIRWKLPLHGTPTSGTTTLVSAGGSANKYPSGTSVQLHRVSGHRDTNSTACPGEALYAQLPELRRRVAGAALPGPATGVVASLSQRSVRFRRPVTVNGQLFDPTGVPLAGEPVEVQLRRPRRWISVRALTTAPDGRFLATLRPRVNTLVRARFLGRPGVPPSTSPAVPLKVQTLISLRRPARRGRALLPVRVRGRVAPRKRVLFLVLQRRAGGRFKRLGIGPVRVRRGRFATVFRPQTTGLYRFYLSVRGDRSNAGGRSTPYVVQVRR